MKALKRIYIFLFFILFVVTAGLMAGCSSKTPEDPKGNLSFGDIEFNKKENLEFAELFTMETSEDGYVDVTIMNDGKYLIIPKGAQMPVGIPSGYRVLNQGAESIYVAATAVMDMFIAMDALDHVHFSSTDAKGWFLEEARKAHEDGRILFAGKYSEPDFELLLERGCTLAVENTMISHSPQAAELLEEVGIDVLVDYSSYERDARGRMEWIKLYGAITGKEDAAKEAFEKQSKAFDYAKNEASKIIEKNGTPPVIAVFSMTANGSISVRTSSDYIPNMIRDAGGEYAFAIGADTDKKSSTTTIGFEDFYLGGKDADYLIYNGSIEQVPDSLMALVSKNSLFEKFKAVKNNKVYCAEKNMYQSSMELGDLITDISLMIQDRDEDMRFLYRLE